MTEDLYCKLYINSKLTYGELVRTLSSSLKGTASLRTIRSNMYDASVFENEGADPVRALGEGGFVYYAFYVELEPTAKPVVDRKACVDAIKKLIVDLKQLGMSITPACDFEADLGD